MVGVGLVLSQMGTESKGVFPAENSLGTVGFIKACQPTVLRKVLKHEENFSHLVV